MSLIRRMEKPDFDEDEKTPTQALFDNSVKVNDDPDVPPSKDDRKWAMHEAIAQKIVQDKDDERRKRSEKLVQKIAHCEELAEKAYKLTRINASGSEQAVLDRSTPSERLEMLEPKTYSPFGETKYSQPMQKSPLISPQPFFSQTVASRLPQSPADNLLLSYKDWPASPTSLASPNDDPVIGADGLVILTPYMSTNKLNAVLQNLPEKLRLLLRNNKPEYWPYVQEWFRIQDHDINEEETHLLQEMPLSRDITLFHWNQVTEWVKGRQNVVEGCPFEA